jgi:hypothetical protein
MDSNESASEGGYNGGDSTAEPDPDTHHAKTSAETSESTDQADRHGELDAESPGRSLIADGGTILEPNEPA